MEAGKKNKVVMFTQPECAPCVLIKKKFKAHHVPFDEIDLSEYEQIAVQFRREGFTATPIIFAGEYRFAGYRPEMIQRVIAEHGTPPVRNHKACQKPPIEAQRGPRVGRK